MISFEQIEKLFSCDSVQKCGIEIEFRLKESEKFDFCCMGLLLDKRKKRNVYWYGLTPDGENAYDFATFEEMAAAPVFDGLCLCEIWDRVELLSFDACDPMERIREYQEESERALVNRVKRRSQIIFLAYVHRYLCPVLVIVLPVLLGGPYTLLIMGIGCLIFALYSLIGYRLRWKHIYCSYQKVNRQKMTPDNVSWGRIKKSDAYGTPAMFAVMGVLAIVCYFI